MQNTQKFQMVS